MSDCRYPYTFVIFLISWLVLPDTYAADPNQFTQLSKQEGLSHSLVNSIYQDRKGFLWVGTKDGLNRYDGFTFEVYQTQQPGQPGIYSSEILSVYQDTQHRLWIKHSGVGLSLLNPTTNTYQHFLHSDGDSKSISADIMYSNSSNQNVVEDCQGTIWVRSVNGLNQYVEADSSFVPYYFDGDSGNPSSPKNDVTYLHVDQHCTLWVGTRSGLYKRPASAAKFEHVRLDPKRIMEVTAIAERANGQIWVGTTTGLFFCTDGATESFQPFSYHDSVTQDQRLIRCITEDNVGTIWVGTNLGVMTIAPTPAHTHPVTYALTEEQYQRNGKLLVDQILVDSHQNVWIRLNPSSAGLFRYDKQRAHYQEVNLREYHHPEDKPRISCLYEDDKNVLWIGTWKEGLYQADLNEKPFHYIRISPHSNSRVNDIHAINTLDNALYLGTSLGLFREEENTFAPFGSEASGKIVGALATDAEQNLWIGALDYKLARVSPNGRVTQFDEDFPAWSVRDVLIADGGTVWVATASRGLVRYSSDTDSVTLFPLDTTHRHVQDNWINVLVADGDDLWLGTRKKGLVKFDTRRATFTPFPLPNELSPEINALYQQGDSVMWMGTDQGLLRVNLLHRTVRRFDESDGLTDNFVAGLLADEQNNLWISTHDGLSKMSLVTYQFTNYSKADGLPSNEFNEGAAFKSPGGRLYFGGVNGVSYFCPQEIVEHQHPSTVHITQLFVRGEKIGVGDTLNGQAILSKSLIYQDTVTLSYRNNAATLAFVALDYSAPEKIKFKYRLTGFERGWTVPTSQVRQATYTNLPPGRYVFEVRASSTEGFFYPESTDKLVIVVTPPWWNTLTFRVGLFFFSLLAAYALYWFRTRQLRRQKLALQQKVRERTDALSRKTVALGRANQQLKEQKEAILWANANLQTLSDKVHRADMAKIRFFTNVSHEFRTPLTLILGPLYDLMRYTQWPKETTQTLQIIDRNAQQLLKLINQLLYLGKVESEDMSLRIIRGDVMALIRKVADSFRYLADSKEILFEVTITPQSLETGYDGDKVEKVLYNLIANAFKFTPPGGKVTLRVHEQQQHLIFRLTDTGRGIAKDEQEKIFDYYYQSETEDHPEPGSGIGLALSHRLVQQHGGDIRVKSTLGVGTEFEFYIKLCTSNQQIDTATPLVLDLPETLSSVEHNLSDKPPKNPVEGKTILVVDDHEDMRVFLRSILEKSNRVFTAEDGQVALAVLEANAIDFIISDVMMPRMDGIALCKTLKSDDAFNDIPLILLTARADDTSEIMGLEIGADDYVAKPFNSHLLLLRMSKIFRSREKLQQQLAQGAASPVVLSLSTRDQAFLHKLDHLIEAHLTYADLNGDILAEQFVMSKGHLYRKVKSLTGCSVHVYIKNFRLKKAAQLIGEGENIAQAAYAVGFDNPSYFTRSFSKLFGVPPSKYHSQAL